MNCDNLIDQDYSEILDYHQQSGNEITVVAAVKNIPIAYGTIETERNGRLSTIVEKPEITFKVNSGMYILEPHLIDEIPENVPSNLTDLIARLQAQQRKVGVFPVWHSSWVDIGDWDEYLCILRSCRV
jgi:NDP-sugar pyrophosphorylase family protein